MRKFCFNQRKVVNKLWQSLKDFNLQVYNDKLTNELLELNAI